MQDDTSARPGRAASAAELRDKDDEYVRRAVWRALDPQVRRLRRDLPAELGGPRTPRREALAASLLATRATLQEAGLFGPASQGVLEDLWATA